MSEAAIGAMVTILKDFAPFNHEDELRRLAMLLLEASDSARAPRMQGRATPLVRGSVFVRGSEGATVPDLKDGAVAHPLEADEDPRLVRRPQVQENGQ